MLTRLVVFERVERITIPMAAAGAPHDSIAAAVEHVPDGFYPIQVLTVDDAADATPGNDTLAVLGLCLCGEYVVATDGHVRVATASGERFRHANCHQRSQAGAAS